MAGVGARTRSITSQPLTQATALAMAAVGASLAGAPWGWLAVAIVAGFSISGSESSSMLAFAKSMMPPL